MSQPLVSIIIPTYNAKDFVVESIESVLMQDYQNIQVVISDDASTDNTPEIIKQLVAKYPDRNIKVAYNQENLGITKNCNQCLQMCDGEYIAFHAGDDVMLPQKLSTQVAFMLKNPDTSACYHNVQVFSEANNKVHKYNSFYRNIARNGDVYTLLTHGSFVASPSLLIRAKDIPKNGYLNNLTVFSDWFFLFEILDKSKGNLSYINKVLSKYRRSATNFTKNSQKKNNLIVIDAQKICNSFLCTYPEYKMYKKNILAMLLYSMRKIDENNNYTSFLLASFILKPKIKIAILILIKIFLRKKI